MSSSLKVSEREGGTAVDIPLEDDGSLLSSSLEKHFNESSGLRFRSTETKTIRGLRCVNGKFYPPEGGWKKCVYFCGDITKYSKRKAADAALEDNSAYSSKAMRNDTNPTDLILLGLEKDTTEEHIRECFGKFGELQLVSIKRDTDGVSKGFGFIRFAAYESQKTVLGNDSNFYLVNGRWCEVKTPLSKIKKRTDSTSQESKFLESKIFVGHCSSDITPSDLRQYFSKFGEVAHVYMPPNRAKPFAFVTFKDPAVVQSLLGEAHNIKGNSLNVRPAAERSDPQMQYRKANLRNVQTSNSTIGQNVRLNNEELAHIRDILENQDTDQIDRLCQPLRPCTYTSMMSTKLTLTSLVKIIQSQGQLLPLLVQSAANLAEGVHSTLAKNQAQQGPPGPYQAQQGPPGPYQAQQCPPNPYQAQQGPPGPYQAQQGPPGITHQTQRGPARFENQQLMDHSRGYFTTSTATEVSNNYAKAQMQRGSGFKNSSSTSWRPFYNSVSE